MTGPENTGIYLFFIWGKTYFLRIMKFLNWENVAPLCGNK